MAVRGGAETRGGVDAHMNDQLRTHRCRRRRRAAIAVCLTASISASAFAAAPAPAPAAAPRCPACVVAVPELIDLAGAALVGVSAGEAVDRAAQAVESSHATRTGVRIARHPRTFRTWIRWANGNTASGRNVWRAFRGKPARIYRWLRGSYSLKKLRKKLPRAAIACVVSGTIVGIHKGSAKEAAWSCLGAALGALSAAKKADERVAVA